MSDEPIPFDDYESAENTALKVISNASRSVCLYASLTNPTLFNSDACVASFSKFARSSRVARVQVLIDDHKLFAIRNPAFLDLAQRLTGRIEIRSVPAEVRSGSVCYLVGDQRSVWYLPDIGALSGTYEKSNHVKAQKLTELFLIHWEHSIHPQDYRRLDF